MYFNFAGIGFVIVASLISMMAQFYVQSSYNKYKAAPTQAGMTGFDVARTIMAKRNINDVSIVPAQGGELSDHYDPTKKVVALSSSIYNGTSIASVAVAAHEIGHVIQHHEGYAFITIRNRLLPVALVGNKIGMVAIMIGIFAGFKPFFWVGVVGVGLIALFQLVTLPVEFDASRRALNILSTEGYLTHNEVPQAKQMLTAAALTYVAALLATLLTILRYVAIFNSRSRD